MNAPGVGRLGVRARLFLVSVALIALVGAASAVFLERALRQELRARAERELLHAAEAVRAVLEVQSGRGVESAPQVLAERLSASTSARVTVVAASGEVIGESARVARPLSNHGDRPEIRDAREHGRGVAWRVSETRGEAALYVAVQLKTPPGAILRLSLPTSDADEAVQHVRVLIGIAGGLGLMLAMFMSGLASHLLSKPLRELLESARAMAEGRTRRPIAIDAPDEIGGLASSINRLGLALQDVVSQLASERDRIEAVLEGMDEAVIALDAERRVTLVNRAGLSLLGLEEAPIGRSLLEALRAPALHDAVAGALGQRSTLELELPGPPPRQLLAQITPQRAAGGSVVVLLDVTRLRRLETVRRDFVANVSHELRTPVSVIRANAEALRDGALEDPRRAARFLDALIRNADRLAQLISDLLDIARIEAGRYEIRPQAVQLTAIAAVALENVARLAEEQRCEVRVALDPALRVRGDAKALEHVLINLLENAVKYTTPGGHVHVDADVVGKSVRLTVRDDGPGIPPEHRERVFERFYRIDAGRSKEMGGTGLGLSIVKHLVLAMDGAVGVEANDPTGCIFWVELPLMT